MPAKPNWALAFAIVTAFTLTACGGGGDDGDSTQARVEVSEQFVAEADAPAQVGDTAADGFNWFNFRRQQAGLTELTRNATVDSAAFNHSYYQRENDIISHEEIPGKTGFTGISPGDRLEAAGYVFPPFNYAYGEVISMATNPSGFVAADALVTAIYHRFVILEPVFTQAGAGSSTRSGGSTWFTTKFTADDLLGGLGTGRFVTWPAASQTNIPTLFLTDSEVPDPLPAQNAAGYPISLHADITSEVAVEQFTLQGPGGSALPVRLLTNADDAHTPSSVAAIVPLSVLSPNTVYEAHFIGSVDGVPVNRRWTFTTR